MDIVREVHHFLGDVIFDDLAPIHAIGHARGHFEDAHFQHVAWLGAVHEDRTSQDMTAVTRKQNPGSTSARTTRGTSGRRRRLGHFGNGHRISQHVLLRDSRLGEIADRIVGESGMRDGVDLDRVAGLDVQDRRDIR